MSEQCGRCGRKLSNGTVTGPASGEQVCRVCAGAEARTLDEYAVRCEDGMVMYVHAFSADEAEQVVAERSPFRVVADVQVAR